MLDTNGSEKRTGAATADIHRAKRHRTRVCLRGPLPNKKGPVTQVRCRRSRLRRPSVQRTEVRWTATTPPTALHTSEASRPVHCGRISLAISNLLRKSQFQEEYLRKETGAVPPSPPEKCAALNAETPRRGRVVPLAARLATRPQDFPTRL